jgi:ADP-heptose:LPS heptosyltransferase
VITSDPTLGMQPEPPTALVHLAAGLGNIVLATPLLVALGQMGFTIDLLLDADYPETSELFRDWSLLRLIATRPRRSVDLGRYHCVVPAIAPFYWHRFGARYHRAARAVPRPPDQAFYEDEQEYYLSFARRLGYPADARPYCRLPIGPDPALHALGVTGDTVVLAPGCKTGEMAAKRWPLFDQLADRFHDVAVVGTADDLRRADGTPFQWPPHVRVLAGRLTLRQTACALAAAGAVVGNDSGLSHVAAAVGAPTVMLFGPTPHRSLGRLPPNVTVLRSGLPCEPCWFGQRLHACRGAVDCLKHLSADTVAARVRSVMAIASQAGGPPPAG